MCLAIPGKVTQIDPICPMGRQGTVAFGGVQKRIMFDLLPDVEVGEYVLVHVGVAISKVDEQEAQEVFAYIEQMGELEEAGIYPPSSPAPAESPLSTHFGAHDSPRQI